MNHTFADPPAPIDTQTPMRDRLLAIFRALALIRVLLALLFIILPGGSVETLGVTRALTIIEALLLFAYLSARPLQTRLGRAYLPIAIGWATVMPLIAQNLALAWTFDSANSLLTAAPTIALMENTVVLGIINQTILVLIVPLIVVGWAYSRTTLALYCTAILVGDLAMTAIFFYPNPTLFLLAFALIVFRTLLHGVIGIMINQIVAIQLEQQRRLIAANAQLREYAAMREQLATSRERMRLARELHDTLAHTLTAATVQLEAVGLIWTQQPDKAQAMVTRSAAMMRDGLSETRRALAALRAGSLDTENLTDAITALADSLMTRYPIAITVDAPARPALDQPAVEHGIYRIAQEALFNAARHSGAAHIAVTITAAPDRLTVTVQDDGRGFAVEAAQQNGHYGIRGMHERAGQIAADLRLTSRIGGGTTVTVTWTRREGNDHAHTDLR